MRTIVYEDIGRNGASRGWWWADQMNHRKKHGPFGSKDDAADAARAAAITQNAEHERHDRDGHPR